MKHKKNACRRTKKAAKKCKVSRVAAAARAKGGAAQSVFEASEPAAFKPEEFRVEEAKPHAEPKWVEVQCPYCDEPFELRVDPSNEEGQSLTQDCQVCCKPIQISVDVEEGEVSVFASRA